MNAERRERAEKAIALARSVIDAKLVVDSHDIPRHVAETAGALEDMAREVIRLQHVIDNIAKLYTTVDPPLANYLKETGDL